MRQKGRVVEWNDSRGYGFVVTQGTEQRIFLHVGQFAAGRARRPRQGDILVYEVRPGERGKLTAAAVHFASEAGQRSSRSRAHALHWGPAEVMVALFGVALLAMAWTGRLPWQIAAVYPVLGGVTWLVYAHDKQAAARGRWRTPESTLQLLALRGGWPGAWLAQMHLRHKSRKVGFRLTFWIMVLVNLVVLFGLSRVFQTG